jgi:hypothetical protein
VQATNPNNRKSKNGEAALGLANGIERTNIRNAKNNIGMMQAPVMTVPYETRFLRDVRYRQIKAVTGTVASIGKTKVSK